MHSDDEDSASSTSSQNLVTHKHLIKFISLRISNNKNIIQAFIPDFDKKICKEVLTFTETCQKNQNIITKSLSDA